MKIKTQIKLLIILGVLLLTVFGNVSFAQDDTTDGETNDTSILKDIVESVKSTVESVGSTAESTIKDIQENADKAAADKIAADKAAAETAAQEASKKVFYAENKKIAAEEELKNLEKKDPQNEEEIKAAQEKLNKATTDLTKAQTELDEANEEAEKYKTEPPEYTTLKETTFNVEEFLKLPQDEGVQEMKYFESENPLVYFFLMIIQFATRIIGALAVIMLIIGGFVYMTSMGNEQNLDKAKDIVKYSLIGLVVALLSYVIVLFVQALFNY